MKRAFYILLIISFSRQIFGQTNLVINPSFESYSGCPTGLGEMFRATGWDSYTGSPDYFNICGTTGSGVPGNSFGYQIPSSGNAYGGVITYYNNILYREIMGGTLQLPLTVSQKYFFSFMISRGHDNLTIGYSTNKIGVKFTQTNSYTASINNYSLMANNSPHYFDNTVITDTLNWIKIKGSFIADSAYKFIMIGNFFDDANTTITNQSSGIYAFYYIDDVCVSTDSAFASNWTGLKEASSNLAFKVYPNPAFDFISLTNSQYNRQCKVLLIDKYGQIVLDKAMPTSNKIDITNISEGLYFIQIISDGKTYWDKILIRH